MSYTSKTWANSIDYDTMYGPDGQVYRIPVDPYDPNYKQKAYDKLVMQRYKNNYATGGSITMSNDLISSNRIAFDEPTDTVKVDAADYRELLDERKMLAALNEAGVEDWEGYGEALGIYRATND